MDADLSEPAITRFDDNGDLRLILQDRTSKEKEVFIVSSKAMSLACDAWNSMLNGSFRESQKPCSGHREIELPDDDPEALAIILNIAHLRFNSVPKTIEFSLLKKVTILTDKYDATHLLVPWYSGWLASVGPGPDRPKSELHPVFDHWPNIVSGPAKLKWSPEHNLEDWLWILWELGQEERFESLALSLVKTVRVGPAGECLTASGRTLDPSSDLQHIPPDIIESIMEVREKTVSAILEVLHDILDTYIQPNGFRQALCCHGSPHVTEEQLDCDSMTIGSLYQWLRGAGLDTQRMDSSSSSATNMSINDLSAKFETVKTRRYAGHGSCLNSGISDGLREDLSYLVQNIPSPLRQIHRSHLQRQAKKLRPS
ncbi:uncharacterized protein BKA78DRAFT_355147 [Phyllosticta capitalensis]|uniref:uncharacterized protein n=1 Tax=Phyllosticta capitalensis TaxID=121624 RepID=UPI00312DE80C